MSAGISTIVMMLKQCCSWVSRIELESSLLSRPPLNFRELVFVSFCLSLAIKFALLSSNSSLLSNALFAKSKVSSVCNPTIPNSFLEIPLEIGLNRLDLGLLCSKKSEIISLCDHIVESVFLVDN